MLAVACFVAPASAPASTLDEALETVVKATFIHRFASFISWPEGHFHSPGQSLILCVAGRDPFGDVLDQAVTGERAAGRIIEVRRFDRARRGTQCDIMYIGEAQGQTVSRSLQLLAGEPVLTITDQSASPVRGVIHFETVGNRVRFHIDENRASRAGLTGNSRLLSLALSVRRREAG